MSGKNLNKVLSVILSLCLVFLLFGGSFVLPSSAATGDKMFVLKHSRSYPAVALIAGSSNQFVPGNSYTFTCKFIISNGDYSEANLKQMFAIWAVNATDTDSNKKPFWTGMTGFNISYDERTATVTAKFTASNDTGNNRELIAGDNTYVKVKLGDRNSAARTCTSYYADPSLVNDSTGVDLLANFPISSANYLESGSVADNHGKWVQEYTGFSIEDKGDTFPETTEEPAVTDPCMVHFPAGYNNYHVLAYKGGNIAAGTYRFTVDEYAVGDIKSYVNLFVNDNYATAVEMKSDTLSGNKRTVEFTLYGAKTSFLMMIGNYNLGKDMDTYYNNPELYKIENDQPVGSNLVDAFRESNLVFTSNANRTSAERDKWTSLNWAKGYIEIDDFNAEARMLKLGGFGDGMHALSLEKALEPGVTYQFEMDYRANGGVSANKQVQANVGNDLVTLNANNSIFRTDTGTHLSVRFKISDNAESGKNNFRIYLGQSWPQKRNGTVYFANLSLKKVVDGKLGSSNLFTNGDFHKGDVGVVTDEKKDIVFSGWQQVNVMSYSSVELLEIPEGFFGDDKELNCENVYEFKGGDMYKPQFNFQFSPNKTYRLSYDYSCAKNDTVNVYIISKDNSITAQKVSRITDDKFRAVYDIQTTNSTNEYTDSKAANTSIRFALNNNSYDSTFYISNIKIYEVSNGEITGANLVYNLNPILSDKEYGFTKDGDKKAFELAKDDSNIASQKTNIAISWVGNLNYKAINTDAYSNVVKTNGEMFNYYDANEEIVILRNTLLEIGEGYNPLKDKMSRYYDANINICDLVRLEENKANGIDEFEVVNEQKNAGIYNGFNKVVCYGDSITQGMGYESEKNKTYPGRLQSMLGNEYTVINSGDPGEKSYTIMARQGALSLTTSKELVFLEGTDTIIIGNESDNGFITSRGDYIDLTGMLGNQNPLNNIVINGKEYKVSLSNFVWNPRSYTVKLTRFENSEALTIPNGTKVTFNNYTKPDQCDIYFIGANGDYESGDDLVAQFKAMVDRHGSNNFLIIIPYFYSCTSEFKNAFGDHCIDFKGASCSDSGFAYAGITKTAEDEQYISEWRVPLSFRLYQDNPDVHLNDKGYDLMAHLLYEQGKTINIW